MIQKTMQYFFRKSFLIYGVIGAFVTIVQIAFLYLMRNFFGLADFISLTAAYVVALVLHYFLNKHVTFSIEDKKVFNMMSLRYIAVVIISYIIYVSNMYILNNIFHLNFSVALVLTLGINYVINYFLYEKVVFKNDKSMPAK